MTKAIPDKRSPLKQPPPRQAGESVQAAMDDFLVDRMLRWLFFSASFGLCAATFWIAHLMKASIEGIAWLMSVLFVFTLPIAYIKIKAARVDYGKMKQGRDGERVVGAMLDELRRDGYSVLHDVPDAKKATFNIDHIAIGPGGVFAIETKTFSKVGAADEKIRYENGELVIPGIGRGEAVEHILGQARANADFVRHYLAETTRQRVHVQPVVVFPGWYVTESDAPVWVLSGRRVFARIGKAPERLSPKDIGLYTQRLRIHVSNCFNL